MLSRVSVPRSFRASQAVRRVVGLDTDVCLREWTVWIPELEPKHDGVRIGHLSDVHVGVVTPDRRIRNAVALLAAADPDLFLLTGDFASRRPAPLARLGRLLDGLPPASTYFVLGNHDHLVDAETVTRELETNGYTHLDNRHQTVELRGAPLHLIGLDDPVTRRHRPAQAVSGLPSEGTRVLLAHQAESVGELLELGHHVDLCVSGHTHGGQIYVPGVTDNLMARLGIRHVRGLRRYDDEGPWLHVTHGVGSAVTPLRMSARPEVGLLTLRRDRSGVRFRG
jgi:predicted MPP superfamily phosphohydrolase